MSEEIGDRFQQQTKYFPGSLKNYRVDLLKRGAPIKRYPDAIRIVKLPRVSLDDYAMPLVEALYRRRSKRDCIQEASISLETLAFLLWAIQGVTGRYKDILFRTAPSAGALYPVETYLSVRAVHSLEPGIYHYRVDSFELEWIKKSDLSDELALAALGQTMVQKAQVTFIWTAVLDRTKWKYKERAYRYIYLDAGHICQNLYLAAEAAGLGCCAIGAFFDDWINKIIDIDGFNETVIYLATVCVPKHKRGGAL